MDNFEGIVYTNAHTVKAQQERLKNERSALEHSLQKANEEREKFLASRKKNIEKQRYINRVIEQENQERLEVASADEHVWDRVSELIEVDNGHKENLVFIDLVTSSSKTKKSKGDDEEDVKVSALASTKKKTKSFAKSDISRMASLIEDLKLNPPLHRETTSSTQSHSHTDLSF